PCARQDRNPALRSAGSESCPTSSAAPERQIMTSPQPSGSPLSALRSPPSALVRLDNVTVRFGAQTVLNGVSLPIERGQTLVVIGESGCGKTVLLRLLIGLLRPTIGRVLFDGKDLAQLGDRELTRQRLRFGFLFQGAALFDSLTVFDNVALGLREQRRLSER